MSSKESWNPPSHFFDVFVTKDPGGWEAYWRGGGVLKANQFDRIARPRPEHWIDDEGPEQELKPYQPPDNIPTPEQQRPPRVPRIAESDAKVWVCGRAVLDLYIQEWRQKHVRYLSRAQLIRARRFTERELRKLQDRGKSPLDKVDWARRKTPGKDGSPWTFDPTRLRELSALLETLPAPSPKPRTGRAPRSKTP